MNSFVKDLYYGEISPWERGRPQDPKYADFTRRIIDIQKHFKDTLPPEQWKRFEELENLNTQSLSIDNLGAFSYGLSMGILLMIDVINFKDNQLAE